MRYFIEKHGNHEGPSINGSGGAVLFTCCKNWAISLVDLGGVTGPPMMMLGSYLRRVAVATGSLFQQQYWLSRAVCGTRGDTMHPLVSSSCGPTARLLDPAGPTEPAA